MPAPYQGISRGSAINTQTKRGSRQSHWYNEGRTGWLQLPATKKENPLNNKRKRNKTGGKEARHQKVAASYTVKKTVGSIQNIEG